jgi:hypothetical protein
VNHAISLIVEIVELSEQFLINDSGLPRSPVDLALR